jgi:PRTRC genetic system protein B
MNSTTPLVQLTFYPDAIFCTRYDTHGQRSYPVAPQDVAEAVADITFSTGWLPPHTLFVERRGGQTTVAIHVPKGRHTVHVDTGEGVYRWTIPMPDLVFVGRGNRYWIFAARTAPAPDTVLYHAPCPNVFEHGGICAGTTPFPEASPEAMHTAFGIFISGSRFTPHLSYGRVKGGAKTNILALWQELAARPSARFPLRTLRPFPNTIAGVLG